MDLLILLNILLIIVLVLVIYVYHNCNYTEYFENKLLTIMQTHKYKEEEIPDAEKGAMKSWKNQLNFNYFYITNDDSYQYLLDNFDDTIAETFKSINIGAYKADFFRYCWIYKNGGIYADTDTICLINLNEWLKDYEDIDIIITKDEPNPVKAFYQAFIYSKNPNNILFKVAIDMIVENVKEYKNGKEFGMFEFTGPGLLYNAFIKINSDYQNKDVPTGKIETNNGKMLIMTWNYKDKGNGWDEAYRILDDKKREIFQHKCDQCSNLETDDDYWGRKINKIKWVV